MAIPSVDSVHFETAHYGVFCVTMLISSLLFVVQAMQICCNFHPFSCESHDDDDRHIIRSIIRFHVVVFGITVVTLFSVILTVPIVLEICLVTVCVSLVMTSLTLSLLWFTIQREDSRRMSAIGMFVAANACYFGNCGATYYLMHENTVSMKALKGMMAAAVITNWILWAFICRVFEYTLCGRNESRDYRRVRTEGARGECGVMEDHLDLV